jgi:DNA replication protein DnaC
MSYEKFLADSEIGKDVKEASFGSRCLLDPNLLAWGKTWLENKNKSSLILQGNSGCGKTFFSIALLKEFWRRLQPYPFIIFKISSKLDSQLLSAVIGKSERDADSIIKMCSESTLFILDDLGVETTSERVQRQYFEIFNARYTQNRLTVISTNCSIIQLYNKFGERFYSRLKSFKLVKFPEVDFREKLAIIKPQTQV